MDAQIVWRNVKFRLARKNRAYGWTLDDLEDIMELAEELVTRWPDTGGEVPPQAYLINEAIQILTISKLEYFLKALNPKNKNIPAIVKNSKVLNDTEKDLIMRLYCVRNTIAHNGGHPNLIFDRCIKAHMKKPVIYPNNGRSLTPPHPTKLIRSIKSIYKLILLDIAGNELTPDEKADIAKLF